MDKEKRAAASAAKRINANCKTESTRLDDNFAKSQRRKICADGGSDINLMSPDLFASLAAQATPLSTEKYQNERRFTLATEEGIKQDQSTSHARER